MSIKKINIVAALFVSLLVLTGCITSKNTGTNTNDNQTTNTSTVEVSLTDKTVIIIEMLKMFDQTYQPNMNREDFGSESDFEAYGYSLQFANAFADSLLQNQVTKENAIGLIRALITFPDDLNTVDSVDSLKLVTDQFTEFGLTPEKTAIILVDLAEEYLEIVLDNADDIPVEIAERLTNLKSMISSDRTTFISSISTVTNYVSNVYGQLDASLILKLDDLISGSIITTEEYLVLKNEIISVFEETLPTVEDYKKTYLLSSLLVKSVFVDHTITIDDEMVNAYAVLSHNSNKLFIEFIKDIDYKMVVILNDLGAAYIPSEFYYDPVSGEYISTPAQFDLTKIVETVLYFDAYYEQFKIEHKTQFDAISSVQTTELKNKMVEFTKELLIASVEEFMPEEEPKQIILDSIEELYANIDVFEAANAVYNRIGTNLYDVFISTNGQFFMQLDELLTKLNNGVDEYTLAQDFHNLLVQFGFYNDAMFSQLTKADLEVLIQYQLLTYRFSIMSYSYISLDFDALAESLTPVLADTLYTFIQLEGSLYDVLVENQVAIEIFNHSELITLDYSVAEQVIKAFDEVLTEEVKAQIIENITSLFDVIIANPIEGIVIEDVVHARTELIANLNEAFAYIDTLATYDFENLTPEQDQEFQNFLDLLYFSEQAEVIVY